MASLTTSAYPADRLDSRVRCDVPVLPGTCVIWYPAVPRHGGNVPCVHRRYQSRSGTAMTVRYAADQVASSSALGVWMSTDQRDGGRIADGQGPTVPRMLVGIQLHRFREAAGITPDQAAYEIRASRSKISRMENGLVRFKERDVTDLLTLYGVTDEKTRSGLVTLTRQANTPGWWSKYGDIMADWFEAYLGLEMAASVIRTFELQFVHGLFQTEDYARAVTMLGHTSAPADEIDRR